MVISLRHWDPWAGLLNLQTPRRLFRDARLVDDMPRNRRTWRPLASRTPVDYLQPGIGRVLAPGKLTPTQKNAEHSSQKLLGRNSTPQRRLVRQPGLSLLSLHQNKIRLVPYPRLTLLAP